MSYNLVLDQATGGIKYRPEGVRVNEVAAPSPHYTGETYGGGIVFYTDGEHGLIAAEDDIGLANWGETEVLIGGTSAAIGTGQANTTAILNGTSLRPCCASLCDELSLSGYTDWYLPSENELREMVKMRDVLNLKWGNPPLIEYYYPSSTEYNSEYFVGVVMYDEIDESWSYVPKQGLDFEESVITVRPIRSF